MHINMLFIAFSFLFFLTWFILYAQQSTFILGGIILAFVLILQKETGKERTPDSASFEGYGEEMAATRERLQ